jgi:mono/diheme cytochrome c family protein
LNIIFMVHPMRRLAIATLAVLVSTATPSTAQDESGEALLSTHCAMCHAVGRSGRSPHAEAPPFRSLGQRYALESLEEALGEGLLTGHPDMPEFKFTPRQVGAIVRYLRSIQDR